MNKFTLHCEHDGSRNRYQLMRAEPYLVSSPLLKLLEAAILKKIVEKYVEVQ